MIHQLSDKWFKERRCRITASKFSCVLAKPTTKKYIEYKESIVDAIRNIPDFDTDDKPWFHHGKEMEPEAIGSYAFFTGVDVLAAGLFIHPELDYVAGSPDGLIDEDGNIEAKSRKSLKEHLKSVKAGVDKKYLPQIQGCLWINSRKWCDFISYYKSEPCPETGQVKTLLHIHRVFPDLAYHEKLKVACEKFMFDVIITVKNKKEMSE